MTNIRYDPKVPPLAGLAQDLLGLGTSQRGDQVAAQAPHSPGAPLHGTSRHTLVTLPRTQPATWHFKLREARLWAFRRGEDKLKIGDFPLSGSAPLQFTSFLLEDSREEVTELPVHLTVGRYFG